MDQNIVDLVGLQQLRRLQKAPRGSTGQQRGAISSVNQSTAEPRFVDFSVEDLWASSIDL